MVWTVPKTSITEFDVRRFPQSDRHPGLEFFTAHGYGFYGGAYGFLFVRAGDLSRGLYPADLIPCEDVTVDFINRGGQAIEKITFRASLHEREAGCYHLVGWCQTDPETVVDDATGAEMEVHVNNACIYECALVLQPAPDAVSKARARHAKRVAKGPNE